MSREDSAHPTRPPRKSLPAYCITRTVWFALSLLLISCVATLSRNVPYGDDWGQLPWILEDPLRSGWLFWQQVEHIVAVPKLLMLALSKLTANDYRAGMFLNAGFLSAAALLLVKTAERLRGRSSYADVFFPLVCLHPGHLDNVLWCFQLCYLTPTFLACVLLAVIARAKSGLGWPGALGVSVLLAALTLSLSSGLVLALVASPWLAACGAQAWQYGNRRLALTTVILGLGNLALGIVCMTRLTVHAEHAPPWGHIDVILLTAAKALTLAAGLPATHTWPYAGIAALGLLGFSSAWLIVIGVRGRGERLRAAGLLLFLAGCAAIALAIGCGRACYGSDAGFSRRYTVLVMPFLCAVYLVWVLYPPQRLARLVPAGLALTLLTCLVPNSLDGLSHARAQCEKLHAFERDLEAGCSLEDLAARHAGHVHRSELRILRGLEALQAAGIPPYAALPRSTCFTLQSLEVAPSEIHDIAWKDAHGTVQGPAPQLHFTLEPARHLAGIRLRGAYRAPNDAHCNLTLFWDCAETGFHAERSAAKRLKANGKEKQITFWIDAGVDNLRLDLDPGLGEFDVIEIVLLTRER